MSFGENAARLKWEKGLSWPDVYVRFPNQANAKIRAAARRWKESHPDEFPEGNREKIGVQFTETGNTAEATALTPQIRTLEQLLDVCHVDREIWKVENWHIKTFDGWRGNSEKDLTFDEGKISGYIRDGGILTQTLYSLSARLVRRKPVEIEVTFKPIEPTIKYNIKVKKTTTSVIQDLVFSDNHIGFDKDIKTARLEPYHDRRMMNVIGQIAADLQPDNIIILGDLFDLAQWSKDYARKAEFYWTTQPALLEGHWFLTQLRRACPSANLVYIEGNHEERLDRYVNINVAEAHELTAIDCIHPILSIPHLLGLDALSVKWVDGYANGTAKYNTRPWLQYMHGNIARRAGATARVVLEKGVGWRVFGHIHRCEMLSKTYEGIEPASAISFGCCCHTDGRVPGSSPEHQWQKRFGIISHSGTQDTVSVEVIAVENGKATWRGQTYEGMDYADQLRTLWPDWRW